MINYNTIISNFNDRGTLLQWLKTLNTAVENGALETVTTTTGDDYVIFHFTFADGSTVDSPAIPLEAGPAGEAATVVVGTVSTLSPGSDATVTNSGTSTDAVLNFGIPQGISGNDGAAATVAVGTVSTLSPGSDVTVTNSGTSSAAVLNFGIPQGATGAAGGITNINSYTGAVTTSDGLLFDTSTGNLSSYDFNLTDIGSVNLSTISPLPTGLSALSGSINYALNADKTIGKIYGFVEPTFATLGSSVTVRIPLGITVAAPDAAYDISTYMPGIANFIQSGTFISSPTGALSFDSDGSVYVQFGGNAARSNKAFVLSYPPYLYFFKDFGDTPDNRNVMPLGQRMAAIYREER